MTTTFDCCKNPKIRGTFSTSESWMAVCENCGEQWYGIPQSNYKEKCGKIKL